MEDDRRGMVRGRNRMQPRCDVEKVIMHTLYLEYIFLLYVVNEFILTHTIAKLYTYYDSAYVNIDKDNTR